MDVKSAKRSKQIFNLKQLKFFLNIAHIKPRYFVVPVFLACGAAIAEGISVSLLVPLVRGIINMDFSFVQNIPVFSWIMGKAPKIFDGSNSPVFIMLLVIVFIASVVKNGLEWSVQLSVAYRVRKFSNSLRKFTFDRYIRFGKMYFDSANKGYLQSALLGFSNAIAIQVMNIHKILLWTFMLVMYGALMFYISWRLTLFTITVFPLIAMSLEWLIHKIKTTSQARTVANNILSRNVFNILSCMPLVKLYGMEDAERAKFRKESDRLEALDFSIDKKQTLVWPLQDIVILSVILLLISAAALIVAKMKIVDVSSFLVYFYAAKRSGTAIGNVNQARSALATVMGPARELLKIYDDKGKVFDEGGEKVFSKLNKNIEIKDLDFSYLENLPVLKGVSLSIEKNRMTALIGPTGSGKTTIINLILRFYDCPPGTIFVDGQDIRGYTLQSLREHMALVSQDVLLFNSTLRVNITYGLKRDVPKEELIEITKKARLYDLVEKLPKGFDTFIGDRGVKLSGGEKQRVSIARALLKGSEILFLDEATSALDTNTEKLIQEAIDEVVKNRTVIVIAHRLSTIKYADKIVVIKNGHMVEEGPLEVLLDKKGQFHKYWEEQKFF